jgi:ribonucleoside-diphosphate reductase alpha chain
MYYLRTKAATDAIKFTVDKKALENAPDSTMAKSVEQKDAEIACSIDNPDDCEACGS